MLETLVDPKEQWGQIYRKHSYSIYLFIVGVSFNNSSETFPTYKTLIFKRPSPQTLLSIVLIAGNSASYLQTATLTRKFVSIRDKRAIQDARPTTIAH